MTATLAFAGRLSDFADRHPSVKILASKAVPTRTTRIAVERDQSLEGDRSLVNHVHDADRV